MIHLKKVDIAKDAFIYQASKEADYKECYETQLIKGNISMKKCLIAFFYNPKWVALLYKLRKILVRPFGLITDDNPTKINIDVQKGDKCSFFEVLERNETEIVLFGTDKHLEAWCAIQYDLYPDQHYVLRCSTLVKYHNRLGKVYFFLIRPFHYFVIRDLLNRICKN
ncbi:MAG: DUF2867 domain-containing protein [Bacteroidaceae bacterium]